MSACDLNIGKLRTRVFFTTAIYTTMLVGCTGPQNVRTWMTGVDPDLVRFRQNGTVQRNPTPIPIVGTGVPLPDNRVLTTRGIFESDVYLGNHECNESSLRTMRVQAENNFNERPEDDLVIVDADCEFERTVIPSATRPQAGSRVTITGYPASLLKPQGGCEPPPPVVLNGVIVPKPEQLGQWPADALVIAVDGVPQLEFFGLHGAACAMQRADGEWVVFGLVTRAERGTVRLTDPARPQNPPAKTHRSWFLVNQIPSDWVRDTAHPNAH